MDWRRPASANQAKAEPDEVDQQIAQPQQQEAEGSKQGGLVHDEAGGRQKDVEAPHESLRLERMIIHLRALSRKEFRKAVDSSTSDEFVARCRTHFPAGSEVAMLAA